MAKEKEVKATEGDTFQPATAIYAVHTSDGIVSVEATSVEEAEKLAKEQKRG